MTRVPSVRRPDWQPAGSVHGIDVEIDVSVPHGPFRHRLSPASDWADGAPDNDALAVAKALGNGLTQEEHEAETAAMLRKAVGKDQ